MTPEILYLCVFFYAFCKFDFNKLRGFDYFVIKSLTTDPVIGVFHVANITI